MKAEIVILAVDCRLTNILYNYLKDDFRIQKVVIEGPVPRYQFLKNRIRRLGLWKVFGQILFRILIVPVLKWTSVERVKRIQGSFNLDDEGIDKNLVIGIRSVNSKKSIQILKELNPEVVIINGTRIIDEKVLNCIPAKFVNIHTGITPQYRGVHGGYWALAEGDLEGCGVTIHYVDSGIDTGDVIRQGIIKPIEVDNFITYPFLQFGAGLPLMKEAILDIVENRTKQIAHSGQFSKLWSHPTIFEYIRNRITKRVK